MSAYSTSNPNLGLDAIKLRNIKLKHVWTCLWKLIKSPSNVRTCLDKDLFNGHVRP